MLKKYPFLAVTISITYFILTFPLLLFLLFLHIHDELLMKILFVFGIVSITFFQIKFIWSEENRKVIMKKFLIIVTLISLSWGLILYFDFLPYLKMKYAVEYMSKLDSESRENLENIKMFSYLFSFFGISISIMISLISSISALVLHSSIQKDSK